MNILIVDDEPIELEQLEFLIRNHFPTWNIYKALYGSDAIKMTEEHKKHNKPFQLALMDIKLPGANGLDIAARIKEIIPEVEFIIISAFQNFNYAKQSIHLQVLDYIVKPVIECELVEAIKKFLDLHPENENYKEEVYKVMELVKRNFKDPLRLSQIAETLHLNSSYLSSLFHKEVGKSFSEFLLDYRIEHAKSLLKANKNVTILQISEESGFGSQQYFSKTFRRVVGCTPNEYRKSDNEL